MTPRTLPTLFLAREAPDLPLTNHPAKRFMEGASRQAAATTRHHGDLGALGSGPIVVNLCGGL